MAISITGLFMGMIILNTFYLCSSVYNEACFNTGYNETIFVPLFWASASLFFVLFLTFFISDKIFKKWLILTPFYLLLTAFLVYKAPVYAGGALGVGPTKELVSIWMGILFVIISIIMFIWMSVKEKRK